MKPIHRAAPALPGQPGSFKFLELEALSDHVLGERIPSRWREPTPELTSRGGIEVAFGEVLARRSGLFGFQRRRIELLCGSIGGNQTAATAAIALDARAATGVADGMTDPVGQ